MPVKASKTSASVSISLRVKFLSHLIRWNLHQDDQTLYHLTEYGRRHDRTPGRRRRLLQPDVYQELGVIYRPPTHEGCVGGVAGVTIEIGRASCRERV